MSDDSLPRWAVPIAAAMIGAVVTALNWFLENAFSPVGFAVPIVVLGLAGAAVVGGGLAILRASGRPLLLEQSTT